MRKTTDAVISNASNPYYLVDFTNSVYRIAPSQPSPVSDFRKENEVEISRRQLLGGSIGLASAGLLGACGSSSTGFSLRQSTEGTRVTTGRTISAQYPNNVSAGSLLVAVVTRKSTSVLAPTIGQVSDDQGNHWRQAVEFFSDDFYGLDIWYCEVSRGR